MKKSELKAMISRQNLEISGLRAARDEHRKLNEDLYDKIRNLKNEISILTESKTKLSFSLDEANKSQASHRAQIVALQNQLSEREKEYESLLRMVQELQSGHDVSTRIGAVLTENNSLRRQVLDLQNQLRGIPQAEAVDPAMRAVLSGE